MIDLVKYKLRTLRCIKNNLKGKRKFINYSSHNLRREYKIIRLTDMKYQRVIHTHQLSKKPIKSPYNAEIKFGLSIHRKVTLDEVVNATFILQHPPINVWSLPWFAHELTTWRHVVNKSSRRQVVMHASDWPISKDVIFHWKKISGYLTASVYLVTIGIP